MGNLLGRLINSRLTPRRALPLNPASISSVSAAVQSSTPSIRTATALEALATFEERAKVAKRKLEQHAQIKKLKAKIKKEKKKAIKSSQQEGLAKEKKKKKKKKSKSTTSKGQSGKKVRKGIKKEKKEPKGTR